MKYTCKKIARKLLLPLLMGCLSFPGKAATYYVSATGNDSSSGLTTALAWKTIDKVNAATFTAGDQILFQKDDAFYGSLTINYPGLPGNPITFGAYGTGANPVITGFTPVTTWTNLGGNFWESTNAVSTLSTCNMVTINGVNTPMGRLPQTGYYSFQSHSGSTSITSSSLTGTPDWSGAGVVFRTNQWIINRSVISSQSSGTIVFSPATTYEPINGYGFFIQNDIRTLTYQNAWYYNPITKKIRIYSANQPSNVNVASVDVLVTVHGSYNTIENISFTGANTNAIYNLTGDTYRNLVVKNCSISYSGADGMKLKMLYLTADNNTISDSNNNGIEITQQVNTDSIYIRNNNISNSGLLTGMSINNSGAGCTGIAIANKNNIVVQYNTILNSGYCGISIGGVHGLIKNNFVNNSCSILDDGGGIYTFSSSYHTITGNIVLNAIGAPSGTNSSQGSAHGIYLDYGTNHAEVSYNTIANNVAIGLFIHASDINVHHNTCYNNTSTQMVEIDFIGGIDNVNNLINNNLFIAKVATQLTAEFDFPTAHPQSIGTLNNNYYARPIDDSNTIRVWPEEGAATNYTLAGWQANLSQDANSHKSSHAITTVNDFQFEYNNTKLPVTVTLSQPMIDIPGTKYLGTITLQPFTSMVLMKDYNPATDVPKIIADSQTIHVYPNPSRGSFTVRFPDLPVVGSRIEIFDLSGRKIVSRLITASFEEFNLSGQAAGLYLMKSILGSEDKIHKLVIQN